MSAARARATVALTALATAADAAPAAAPAPQWAQALGHAASDKRLDILRGIARSGSISQAAREAGVSYKAAWQALDTLSNLAGVELVQRAVGGAGGGGARVTDSGLWLLQAAEALDQARQTVLARLPPFGEGAPSTAGAAPTAPVGLAALGLRTSMRNQVPAQVLGLRRVGALVDVTLGLAGGLTLSSRLTRESAELLGLQTGLAVQALCKATAVRIEAVSGEALGGVRRSAADTGLEAHQAPGGGAAHEAIARPEPVPDAPADEADGLSGLVGQVLRVARAGEAQEVVLALPGGLQWVGFTAPGVSLRRGRLARAVLHASAVVLALGA